ncbi:hypothetical protein EH222_02340 [candidate division KSB1 bacterium]|nr:MAG: hypothetical protein EH222_02340 [candidate division KSB1 bacterium]
MTLGWDEIENLRDQTFHRTRELQLKDIDDAEHFVNETGFCFAFKMQKSELPCMWHAAAGERDPDYPVHVQHDPYIGLVWDAKDALAAQKKAYYGKALKKRPTFISLDFFPSFYRLRKQKDGHDYIVDYMRGRLSQDARRIMDALTERSPLVTSDLKLASAMAHPHKRAAFDRAMAELQSKLYIVKIAEFYDPFTFLWDLLERRFADEIAAAKHLTEDAAREKIVTRYFHTVWVSEPAAMARLFGWQPAEIDKTLDSLIEQGRLIRMTVRGEKRPYFAIATLNQADICRNECQGRSGIKREDVMDHPIYIIDGYNYILRLWRIDRSQEHALWEARERLIHQMIAYLGQKKMRIHIVFDGQDVKGVATTPRPAGIVVQFSNAPAKADPLIIDFVRKSKSPGTITVVTSDKPLAESCAHHGCAIMSVEALAEEMAQDHQKSELSDKYDVKMTPKEVEEWLRLFSGEKE